MDVCRACGHWAPRAGLHRGFTRLHQVRTCCHLLVGGCGMTPAVTKWQPWAGQAVPVSTLVRAVGAGLPSVCAWLLLFFFFLMRSKVVINGLMIDWA